jgi:hypothetical protein
MSQLAPVFLKRLPLGEGKQRTVRFGAKRGKVWSGICKITCVSTGSSSKTGRTLMS